LARLLLWILVVLNTVAIVLTSAALLHGVWEAAVGLSIALTNSLWLGRFVGDEVREALDRERSNEEELRTRVRNHEGSAD